ncbi:hypothetical protein RhiirB3_452987 [Rhizophagus irregularis]|nr:hypothetical protein RhiirB3_452987 [Rhizophagus irregularis]
MKTGVNLACIYSLFAICLKLLKINKKFISYTTFITESATKVTTSNYEIC